jgi:hypothetical protein
MNLSSRWCVTAAIALGALSCSDPVPPPAQGAFNVSLSSVSPPNGKACPSGAAVSFDVPSVYATGKLTEVLTTNTYLHSAIDGEGDAKVSCSVKGSSSFTFSGRIASQGRVLELSDGVLTNNMTGTARVMVTDSAKLSSALTSPAADCTIKVVSNSKGVQVKSGSLWAEFSCVSVEHQPADGCGAKGVFVLENCTE